jgi:hypothetical protein
VRTKLEDVQVVLGNVCCVVSQRESTLGKICANSVNCPIHAVDQRHEVRRILLGADALPPVEPVQKKKKKKKKAVPTVAASNSSAAAAAAVGMAAAAPRVLLAAPPQLMIHPHRLQQQQTQPPAAVHSGMHRLDDMAMLPGGAPAPLPPSYAVRSHTVASRSSWASISGTWPPAACFPARSPPPL